MKKFILLTQAQCDALEKLTARVFGYPKNAVETQSESVRVGGGIHVPWDQCVTTRHGQPRKHPTVDLWAYPIDDRLRAVFRMYKDGTLPAAIKARIDALTDAQRLAIRNAIRDAVELDETWRPASVVGG